MTASLVDHLPSADQTRVLWTAYVVLACSLTLLLAGITFARLLVAMTLGILVALGAAALGAAYLPSFSPIALAIAGFGVGLIAGSIGFSIVQSLIVGLYSGLITVLIGLNWPPHAPAPAPPTSAPASDLLIHIQAPATGWAALRRAWLAQLRHLPSAHVTIVAVTAVVVTLVVLLVCLSYPRWTTVIVTAVVGAGTALAAAIAIGLVHHWAPAAMLADRPVRSLAAAGLLALAGVGFQWRFFMRRNDKAKRARPPEPPKGPAVDAAA